MVSLRCLVALMLLGSPVAARAADEYLPLGKNLLGQDCFAQSRYLEIPDMPSPQVLDLVCGDHEIPSGSIQVTPLRAGSDRSERIREAILKGAADPGAASSTAAGLVCLPGRWMSSDGPELLVSSCGMRDGGWPAIRVVGWRDNRLIRAEGPPSVFSVLSAYISGKPQTVTAEDSAAMVERLEAALGAKVVLLDGSETTAFHELAASARLQDTVGGYAEAEEAYRKALAIQRKALGGDSPATGDTMMHLALEVSNQGRFDEARDLFKAAEPLIQKSVDPIDEPRLVSYLALDAANRHSFAEARDLAGRRRRPDGP